MKNEAVNEAGGAVSSTIDNGALVILSLMAVALADSRQGRCVKTK